MANHTQNDDIQITFVQKSLDKASSHGHSAVQENNGVKSFHEDGELQGGNQNIWETMLNSPKSYQMQNKAKLLLRELKLAIVVNHNSYFKRSAGRKTWKWAVIVIFWCHKQAQR